MGPSSMRSTIFPPIRKSFAPARLPDHAFYNKVCYGLMFVSGSAVAFYLTFLTQIELIRNSLYKKVDLV